METYGIPLRGLILRIVSLRLANWVAPTDRVGIGSEQAGHDACIWSAIDCDDELALIRKISPPLFHPLLLIYWILYLAPLGRRLVL